MKNVMTEFQPSLTEWFKFIGDPEDAKKIQEEDNDKHSRLEFLKKTIQLPYAESQRFEAIDLFNKTPDISKILKKKGEELCAIRLVPKRQDLPKLRNRGLALNKCYTSWFLKQKIDFNKYYAEICPHNKEALWSMVIVSNKDGIFGEVIKGHGFQLMHGETKEKLYFFKYDFKKWQWHEKNEQAFKYLKKIVKSLKIKTSEQEINLRKWGASIFNGYLEGYFEVVVLPDGKICFNDYNRILLKFIKTPSFNISSNNSAEIAGLVAYPGKVVGKVKKISCEDILNAKFEKGSILVTENTDVRFLPFMQKAGAIVTEKGSILSHASIVARELRIPCVVSVKKAMKILKDDSLVEIDATKGIIKILK